MTSPDYKDPSRTPAERAESLLRQMSLQEKVAQLLNFVEPEKLWDEAGRFSEEKAAGVLTLSPGKLLLKKPVETDPQVYARDYNDAQRFLVTQTRLGIPALVFGEGLHGYMARGATVFPQAIALGCTWDPDLLERIFTVVAKEMRARGVSQSLSPVLDLGREPRWGRIEECFGEDPFHVAQMGKAAVFGLQGRGDRIDDQHVIATGKHFAGHGQPEGGTNQAPANLSERLVRETHLVPFEAAVKEAGLRSIMASYNEIDGIPSHANRWLLHDVLRGEWGFGGFVIGDYKGVPELLELHRVAATYAEAASQALQAGLDLELNRIDAPFALLVELVQTGEVPSEAVDAATRRVLEAKFAAGLFENPYVDEEAVLARTNTDEHKALALEAAEKSIVLLKNEGPLLPFDPGKLKKFAVIGPNAAQVHFGGYSPEPRLGVSVLEGLRAYGEDRFEVLYAEGCKITSGRASFWDDVNPQLNDSQDDARLIQEAVDVAHQADAVLLVLGGNESTCREAWGENHRGDRDDLNLLGRQEELAKAILDTGKPVAVLLINGRPLTINTLAENFPAILEGWYLGQETGTAVAKVLFGETNPGGKLSVTIPRSIGQLPAYYNQKPTRHRSYILTENRPLFPFGHGLSYTQFQYDNLERSQARMTADETVWVSLEITNAGEVAGDEIVQLYIRDQFSSVTRPVLELKGFRRVSLAPNETRKVRFAIDASSLRFYNRQMQRVVEPGAFDILVGASSGDIRLTSTFWVD